MDIVRLSAAAKYIIFLLVYCCSNHATLASEKFNYRLNDLHEEQPGLAPKAVLSINGYIAVADDLDRDIKLFLIPELENVVTTVAYPQGIDTVQSLELDKGEVVGLDSRGTRYNFSGLSEYGVVLHDYPVKYKVEIDATGQNIVVTDDELLVGEIAAGSESNYVDWELIALKQGESLLVLTESGDDSLQAHCYVLTSGGIQSIGSFSWNEFEYVPENSVVIDREKNAWVFSYKNGKWMHPLDELISADEPSVPTDSIVEDNSSLEGIAEKQRLRKKDPAIQLERDAGDYDTLDLAMLKYADTTSFKLIEEGGLTRQEIVSRALQYYSLPFFYRKRNSALNKDGWERPKQLNNSISTWQTGFRYYWSGYMSPARHQLGLIEGHAVGDIDTSTIIGEGIVGCDCSGCVSAWLGVPRHTTTSIANDPSNLFEKVNIFKSKPGDIFNKKGRHVRMLLNKIDSASGTKFRTIESAKSCGGVCIRVYTAKELASYTPLRYNRVKE